MKSQNKNNKLDFSSTTVLELNDAQLTNVQGGVTPTITTFYFVTGLGVGFGITNTIKN